MRLASMLTVCVAAFGLAVTTGCSSDSGGGHLAAATTRGMTAASFKMQVDSLYAPFDSHPLPDDFSTGAARYDGFADAVAAMHVSSDEISERGSLVSAAHAAAAVLRKYGSITDVPLPQDVQAVFTLQQMVRDMPG